LKRKDKNPGVFEEIPKGKTVPAIEEEILGFWEENKFFERSMDERRDSPRFVFFEGPPTANGRPGVHHVICRAVKDVFCRYKTMRGFLVERKAGWDTHGLPVEIEVEKKLGISEKKQIEEMGVEAFSAACRDSVFTYEKEWREVTRRIGYWIDMDNPYITLTNEYIESVWWLLRQLWDKNLIYRGHKILPYCPRCGTPLASHEVSQGYRETSDPSVTVKMKLKDSDDTFFLVWTTTPWTLISNVALAVDPDSSYVEVEQDGETFILAKDRVEPILHSASIKREFPGSDLVGKEYTRLFDLVPTDKKAFYVLGGDFVTMDDGTGIVHIAPAFGEDDYNVGARNDLPVIQPVDERGRFTDEVTPWAGMDIKAADPKIIDDLRDRGLLFQVGSVTHSYPFCWRCDSPLIYYARRSWYIKTTEFRDQLVENNNSIDWHPTDIGKNRFGNWLEANVDWALSRDRYWGTPLNVWICSSCHYQHCVGSIQELTEMAVELPEKLDLHKYRMDEVKLKCPECGGEMTRTHEVIDAWFDSGSMPYAQWHYPFENKEEFEEQFPADFIAEAVDQTRGWFYSLLTISTLISGISSYKTCIVVEMILDKEGSKMSKSRGNVVDPWESLRREGADCLRWYMISTSPVWVPTRFDPEGVKEVSSKMFDRLKNVYSFFSLYANVDGFDPGRHKSDDANRSELDRWIISRLNTLIKDAREFMDAYDATKTARAIQKFVDDDLSNWYVRRSRDRFWGPEMSEDKISAYQTLHEVLLKTSILIAPIAPFTAELLYQRLTASISERQDSVHLCDYVEPAEGLIDHELESQMELARRIVYLGRAARNKDGLKVRQPLRDLWVAGLSDDEWKSARRVVELIRDELNVKCMKRSTSFDDLEKRVAVPLLNILGPKYGAKASEVAEAIRNLENDDVRKLKKEGKLEIEAAGGTKVIVSNDIRIESESKEGYSIESDGSLSVALDTRLDDELIDEGFAREMINKIQNMRKTADFNVTDKIRVGYETGERLKAAIENHRDYIAEETLAVSLEPELFGEAKEWDINGEKAAIVVERASK
jgi:isoleucyl-tRNA synthetase